MFIKLCANLFAKYGLGFTVVCVFYAVLKNGVYKIPLVTQRLSVASKLKPVGAGVAKASVNSAI